MKCSHKRNILEKHLNELENKVLKQTNNLIQRISKIKEEEIKEAPSCKTCQVNCKIWHTKHNWHKSEADKFLQQLTEIRSSSQSLSNDVKNLSSTSTEVTGSCACNFCEEIFSRKSHLESHILDNHTVLPIEAGPSLRAKKINIVLTRRTM